MEFSNHYLTNHCQWQQYRQLELLPNSMSNPAEEAHLFAMGLNWLWRPLLALLIDELVEEQRVEYLDRCWSIDEPSIAHPAATPLQRFWTLIN